MRWRPVPPKATLLRNSATRQRPPPAGPSLETWAKNGAVLLGGLYVMGLVATNMFLRGIGVADFAVLQGRCIATGLLCSLYFFLLLLLAVGLAIWLDAVLQQASLGSFMSLVAVGVVGSALYLLVITTMLLEMTPWYSLLPVVDVRSLRERWAALIELLKVSETFFFNRGTFATVALLTMVIFTLRKLHQRDQDLQLPRLTTRVVEAVAQLRADLQAISYLGAVLFGLAYVVFFLLKPFAQNVYPNIQATYGGGQPEVVEIQPAAVAATAELAYAGIRLLREGGLPVVTEQVVVWHESDRFVYVSPLRRAPAAPNLVAIDVRSIRSMRQLPLSVRVGGEGEILDVVGGP